MRLVRCLLALIVAAGVPSCAVQTTKVTIPSIATDGCPFILLTRSGGLGYEWQSGVIAAVWQSGRIVRAEFVDRPWQAHVIGQLTRADVAELTDRVNSSDVWDAPAGKVALDFPEHTLTLRRTAGVRRWAETPAATSTPVVAEFRAKLVALPIEGTTRVRQSVEGLNTCGREVAERGLNQRPAAEPVPFQPTASITSPSAVFVARRAGP